MKEIERKLGLTHYNMLSDKLMEVIREKCTGCQMNRPNQLEHYVLFKRASEPMFWRSGDMLTIFRETVNSKELTYKNILRKWLAESPTIEL